MTLRELRARYSDRLRLLGQVVGPLLLISALLRIVLYGCFHDGRFALTALGLALGVGSVLDALCFLVVLAPLACALAVLRLGVLRHGSARMALLAGLYTLALFDACAQYFFFEEFDARYNRIAFEYLIYPTEVFTNLWQSYDLPLVAGASLVGGIVLAWWIVQRSARAEFGPLPPGARWRALGLTLVGLGAALALASAIPAELSANRITSEVAQNGWSQLVRAFRTGELDYTVYYETLPPSEARARAARLLGFPEPSAEVLAAPPGGFAPQRASAPRGRDPSGLDVVVVLEESLGSSVVGALGAPDGGLTPELDRWSQAGCLLTGLVANGNRTVRGLEGVLCSFVPLPGDSLVRKPSANDVATLARVFAARGYATCFLYGGSGFFDHIGPFATRNGWRELIEQADFPDEDFATAWGVADEYAFDALLARQEAARAHGERLFATLLSVSNHRPFDVPPGRVAGKRSRQNAVRYADWALGRYLDAVRERGLLAHTVVLIVGDHGARVYGSQEIPVASYRIPALLLAPDSAWPASRWPEPGWPERWQGARIERLCSQIDLAPSVLSLAGVTCTTPFLGQDLFATPDGPGRAFVHHDNDFGLLTDEALVVLQLQKRATFYRRTDRASDELVRLSTEEVTPELRELERDAASVFQTAYELYQHGRFALPGKEHVLVER